MPHFRRAALQALGGWDAWNVTEDADLGIRIARAGFTVGDLPSLTYEEAPRTLRAWFPQRRRWLKGWLQTLITHTRSPWRTYRQLGLIGTLAVIATMGSVILGALGFPVLTGIFIARLMSIGDLGLGGPMNWLLDTIAVLVFAAGLACMCAPAFLGMRRRNLLSIAPAAVLLPLYNILVFIAAWQAVIELIRAPSRWNKTEHGLSTSSRLRRWQRPAESEA